MPRLHDQATTGQTVARPSYDRPGLAMAGHDRPGLAIAGNDRPGLAMTGHDRPSQARPGLHDVQPRLPPAFMTVSPAKARHPEGWTADTFSEAKIMEMKEKQA